MNKYQKQVNGCESLDELAITLNGLSAELAESETGNSLDQMVDLASMSTFGGNPVKSTSEVWSWDATHILVSGRNNDWETEPRCAKCGEATFHCGH